MVADRGPYTPTFVRSPKHSNGRLAGLVLTLAVLAALVWSAPAGAVRLSTDETATAGIAASINDIRADQGVRRLVRSSRLARAARAHATSMGKKGYFSHSSLGGSDMGHRLQSYYPASKHGVYAIGEVLYWQQGRVTPAEVTAAWLESPPHRSDLLAARWREMGVSAVYVENAPGVFHGRDVTIIVVDFGVRR